MQSKSSDCGAVSGWSYFTARSISRTGLVGMIVIAMTGCPGNRTATATREGKPHAGVTLKIACEDAVVLEAFASRAQGWAGRSGASVAKSAAADADIIIGSSAEVGARAATADAQPVPEALKALEHPGQWIRMLTPYRDTLAAWAGQPCAIPLAGDGAVLVFNTTALTDAKLTEAYRAKFGQPLPNPPRTWDDLAEISEACVAAGRKAGLAPRDPLADFLRALRPSTALPWPRPRAARWRRSRLRMWLTLVPRV